MSVDGRKKTQSYRKRKAMKGVRYRWFTESVGGEKWGATKRGR